MNTQAVIYARTSSDDPRDEKKVSAAQQIKICRALAEHHGLTIIGEYEDRNISGAIWCESEIARLDLVTEKKYNGHRRAGFTAALKHLTNGEAKTLIVWNTTRVARPLSDTFTGFLTDLFKSNSVRILSQEKGWTDYNVFADDISTTIETKILRREIDANAKKAKEAKADLKVEGYRIGPPPYGYATSAAKPGTKINPKQAEAVKNIFHWFTAEGQGHWLIAQRLTQDGIASKRGKPWSTSAVSGILRNPSYIGKYLAADGTLHSSPLYKPIVDEATWFQAQSVSRTVAKISKSSKKHDNPHWLSGGLLRCGACGSAMRGKVQWLRGKVQEHYYTCVQPGCTDRASVKVSELHGLVELLIERREHGLLAAGLCDEAMDQLEHGEVYTKLEELRRQVASVEARKTALAADVGALLGVQGLRVALSTLAAESTRIGQEIALLESAGKQQYPINAGLREQANWLFSSITILRRKLCYIKYHTGHGLPIPAKTGKGRHYWFYPFAAEETLWNSLNPPVKCIGQYANPKMVENLGDYPPEEELNDPEVDGKYYHFAKP